jgi:hypothetical protein
MIKAVITTTSLLLLAPLVFAENGSDADFTSFDLTFELEPDPEPFLPPWLELSISEQIAVSQLSDSQPAQHQTQLALGSEGAIKTWLYGKISGHLSVDWPHQTVIDDEQSDLDLLAELDSAWLQASSGSVSGKIGLDTLAWGEIESSGVLDVLNPVELLPALPLDLTGAPQWWVTGQYYFNGSQLSAFTNLQPEFIETELDAPDTDELEVGGRIKMPYSHGEVALYAARLLPNTATVIPGINPSLEALPYRLVGASGHLAFEQWLLRAELAHKQNLSGYRQSTPFPENVQFDRIDGALALEYQPTSQRQWTVALIGHQILDFDPLLGSPTPDLSGWIPEDEYSGQLLLRLNDRFRNDTLNLTLLSRSSLDNKMWLMVGEIEYQISDPWQITLSVLHAEADAQHPLSVYDDEWMAGLSVTWTP